MPRPKGQVTALAEKYGTSTEFVRSVIKDNPELGIKTESNKSFVLDINQQNALCEKIEEILAKYELPELQIFDREIPTNDQTNSNELDEKIEQLNAEIESLKSELASTKTDLEVAKARAEEREKRIDDLKEAAGQNQKLLEAARVERDAAQDEATSFRKSVFGFYRKKK